MLLSNLNVNFNVNRSECCSLRLPPSSGRETKRQSIDMTVHHTEEEKTSEKSTYVHHERVVDIGPKGHLLIVLHEARVH